MKKCRVWNFNSKKSTEWQIYIEQENLNVEIKLQIVLFTEK